MTKNRLESFSDGVLAVIITIMVLEMKVPHGADLAAIGPLLPVFASYVLSFIFIGVYWNNHHHLLHTVTHVRAVRGGRDRVARARPPARAGSRPIAVLDGGRA